MMTIRLTKSITIAQNDVSINAPRGRMAAFALKRVGAWGAPAIALVHEGFCGSPACTTQFPHSALGMVWAPGSNGISGTFPAGMYRAYVVTDGAPLTVSLTLSGLTGSATLRPTIAVRGGVVAPAPSMAQPPTSPQLFAGGSTHSVGGSGGLNATTVWKDLANGVVPGTSGACVYDGAPPAGKATATYQLPCDGGGGAIPPYVAPPHDNGTNPSAAGPGHFFTADSAGYLLPPGTHSIGGYNNTTGVVNAAYVHQVWLDF
jgi:hypothetical protein